MAEYPRPPARMRGEDPVIEQQVDRGPRSDRGELLQQLDGLEQKMRSAIAPHRLEFDEDAAVGAELDAVLGEGGRKR
jgi:hypothetical protein